MIKIKNIKYILIAVVLVFIISIGILECFWNKENNIFVPSISKEENKKESSNKNEIPATSSPIPAPLEVWKTYTSSQLGFSIKYPEMVYRAYRCGSKKPFYVPLRVFEDKESGIVYITKEYYYKGKYDSELNKYTGPCEKIINSLEYLKSQREIIIDINDKASLNYNPFLTRVFIIKNIKNDTELDKFIKDNYGPGCFANNKKLWKENGIYEIEIKGEDWDERADLGTTSCPWNYMYKILYAPEKNKLMSVNLGQECGFGTDLDSQSYKCYDEEMIDSIEFE